MDYKKPSFVTISILLTINLFVACLSNDRKKVSKIDSTTTTNSKPPQNDSFRVRSLTNIKYERTPERLKRGEYLTTGLLQCLTCHSPRNWDAPGAPPVYEKKGSGGTILFEDSASRISAPNITPDMETGAGTWTDDMLARAIREGVGHDGRALNWQMPSSTFRNLPDEDLASVIVYLRSLPPVHNVVLPVKMYAAEKSEIEKSLWPLTEPVEMPDLSDSLKRGRHLVRLGECAGCHTSHAEYNPGIFAGGNYIDRFGSKVFSANITADSSGIPYGAAGFIFVMRTGKGGTLSPTMPWAAFKNMTDNDLKAIYAYLLTVPPAQHYVNNQQPFTHCAICGMEHGLGDKNKRKKPAGIKLDPKVYDQYAGTYFNEQWNNSYIITRNGNMLFGKQWETGPATELIPQTELRFLAPGWVLPINFIKDKDGRIMQLAEETDYGRVFKKIK